MKAKEYLKSIRYLDRMIENKLDEINHIKDQMTHISVTFTGQEAVQHDRNVHALEKSMAKMIDLQDELTCDLGELQCKKAKAFHLIDSLENKDMTRLLYLRYFQYETWERIAVEMNFSIRQVYRLHGNALSLLDAQMNCETHS